MNKSYKSVWNESTGSWVAVSELATGRSKSKRAKTAISKAILTQVAVGGMSLAGAGAAMAADTATLGTRATSNISDGVAIGVDSLVDVDTKAPTKIGGMAIGDSAYAMGSGIAIGANSQASTDSFAFGPNAIAGGGGTSVGANSYTINDGGLALGKNASAVGAGAIALGMNSSASGSGSLALGQGSVTTASNTVSVGNATLQRKIVNLAAGTTTTDAVNLGQLTAAGLNVDTNGKATNSFVAYDTTAMGKVTLGGGTAGTTITNVKAGTTTTDAVNLGQLTAATGSTKYFNANSTGGASNATGTNAVAIGQTASAAGTNSVALGLSSKTTVDADNPTLSGGIAIGNISAATGNGVTVGQNSASASNGAAVGERAWAKVINSTAVGQNATASGASSVALGQGTTASGSSAVALGQGSLATRDNSVSVGTTTAQRQIVNLAAGTTATDAVNLGQLTAAGITFDTTGKATNAFVAYDSTAKTGVTLGAGTAGAQIHNLVAGTTATDAVNLGQLTAAGLTVDTAGKATNAFVAYDTTAKAKVTLGGGTAGTTLSNVKAGTTATDAVNLGQLTAAGITVDTNGKATNAFVAYDSTAKNSVTLGGGTAGTTITNLKAGIANSDAVAVSQLKSAGFALDASGNVTTPAVVYTAGSIASGKPNVTLNAGTGNSTYFKNGDRKQGLLPVGTVISNVANGIQDTDAASVGQVNDIVNQTGGSAPSLLQGGLLQATSTGSGVVTTGLGTSYKTAAYYSQVAGMGDATGSTPPSDVARAEGLASIAVGSNAYAKGASSTAVGVQAYTSAADAVALGSGSVANTANTVSIGNDGTGSYTAYNAQGVAYTIKNQANTRRLVNMAAGIAATDAVNVGQLTAAGLAVDTAGNVTNSFVAYDSTAMGKVTLGGGTAGTTITNVKAGTSATDAVNLAQLTAATAGTGATKYFNANSTGGAANATGADAVAIGQTASAAGTSSVAVGLSSKTTVDSGNPTLTGGIAIGNISAATGNGVTVGQNSASASNGAAIGERAWAKVINSTAVGQNATASGASSVALGQGTTASGSSSVALGQGSLATRDNSVSVGTATAQRQIVNLAAGTSATDAVNLGQLTAAGLTVDTAGKATNSFVAYDSTAMGKVTLGGGTAGTTLANVKAGTTTTDAVNLGQLTAAGITFDTTGKATNAFVAYDSTAKTGVTLGAGTAGAQIHNLVAGTTATDAVNLGQLTAAGLTVDTAGKATNAFVAYDTTAKAKVTLGGGTAGTTITNVKAGASSATSTDAVNGSQLFAVQTDINALKNAPAASNPYVSIGALANNAGPATTAVAGDIAIGVRANAAGSGSMQAIAMGTDSSAVGVQSMAIGQGAAASLNGDTAIGTNSVATGGGSYSSATALGYAAGATGSLSVALGRGASATGASSVALGANSVADQDKTVSVGSSSLKRKIVNVAAGTSTNDAVNFGQLTAAGLTVDTNGNATNSFVAYDTTAKAKITLGGGTAGTTITNVKAGTTATDAVNLGQLTAAGLTVDTNGKATNAFVAYDTTAMGKVTLGGGTAGTTLSNVKAGTTATDAVNLGQLTAAGITVDTNGKATNAFVAYDSTAKNSVTLGGGTAGTTITNLKAGIANSDAVAVSQLKSAGFTLDASGNVTTPAVVYTAGSIASGKPNVTLNAGTGNSTYFKNGDRKQGLLPVGTVISNVANGIQDTDAASVGQVNDIVNQTGSASPQMVQGVHLLQATSGSGVVTTGLALSYKTAAYYSQVAGMGDATGSTPPSDVARAEGLASIAVGSNAYAKGTSSTAVGVQAYTSAADAVALGSGSVANTANTVSVGNDGTSSYTAYDAQGVAYTIKNQANTRRLVNMAAGQNDTDAVNVGQLKGVTAAIGGGAAVGPDGKVVAPTFEVNGQNYDTIADAINAAAVSGGGTDANAVAYDSTAKTKVTLGGGTAGTTIANVKAGAADMDAVNLAQLKAAGLNVDTAGNVTNTFVAYDSTAMGKVTLGGGTAGTTIANVKAGAADMDAVNLAQLKAAGLSVDTAGKVTNSFVAYDSTAMGKVTLGGGTAGTTIANVKAGTTATDAVNLGQLTAAGLTVDTNGKATNAFVAYDTTAKGKITLGGGSAGTTIANVKAGAADMDAVNLAQLKAAGFNVDTNGNPTNAFVAYDTTAKTGVTLGSGSAGAQIHNLVAGTTATDAVNLAQLTAAGLNVDTAGNATNSFVAYDSTAMDKVTLGGGAAGTTITNVKAGTTATDAVNFSQLKPVVDALGGGAAISAAGVVTGPTYSINNHKSYNVGDAFKDVDQGLSDLNSAVAAITADTGGAGLVAQDATTRNITVGKMTDGTVVDMTNSSGVQRTITGVAAGAVNSSSFDAINGSQLAGVSSSFATAIGGGAMMNPDGSITQPSFSVGGDTVHNVGDAIANLDGRVTSNTDSLTNLQTTVNNITNGGGIANPNAVAYDSSAHDQITLAGNGTAGTKLTGLAAGDVSADSTDAVTGGQLYATNAEVAALQNTVQNFNTTGTAGIGINGKDGKDGAPAAAASANGSDAIAMGDNASSSGDHAIVIGGGATGTNDGVIAIGGNAGASGKDSIAIGNGASAPADNAVALGAHSVADRDNTVSVGSAGNERQITNVAAGTQGTDAVNLNQMNSAVGGIARKAYSGIAAATALTMIPDVDANKTLSIGIGGGTFQGYAATAIGGTARITQNIKVRVGAGWSAAGTTVGAGASYQW